MAEEHSSQDHVLISLSTLGPDVIAFPERRVVLTESKNILQIGRASSRLALGLVAKTGNGLFDSPVMSRRHANIHANIGQKNVYIEDINSMHGTYVNGEKLSLKERRALTTGDKLVFGMAVYRNQSTFQPAEVEVGIDFRAATTRSTTSPSRIFSVPDDCSTDENDPLEEDIPPPSEDNTKGVIASELDITNTEQTLVDLPAMPQLDGPSEVESIFPGNTTQLLHFNAETAWDENQSIHLTGSTYSSSECSCEVPPSTRSLKDLIETTLMDYDGDESVSESWSNNSVDGVDGGDASNNSSGEACSVQGVFIYDTEDSDDLDDDFDPVDGDLESEEPIGALHILEPPACPLPWITSGPARNALPLCQHPQSTETESLFPKGDALAYNSGRAPQTLNDVSVYSLGRVSGKPDFFEARERNKISAFGENLENSHDQSRGFSDIPPSQPAMVPEAFTFLWPPSTLAPATSQSIPEASSAAAIHDMDFSSAYEMQRFREQQQQQQQAVKNTSNLDYPMRAEETSDISSEPSVLSSEQHSCPSISSLDFRSKNNLDISAKGLRQTSEEPQESAISSIPPGRGQCATINFLAAQGPNKGKRKAEDISTLAENEMREWSRVDTSYRTDDAHAKPRHPRIKDDSRDRFKDGAWATHNPPPTRPIPGRNNHAGLPTASMSPYERAGPETRSHKRIKTFAERVGFAALGGATVGALVLSSLIYTAPNFV